MVRWDLPPTSYTDVGLGSGISWALAPDFCEWLLPRFPEEPFGRNSSIAIEFVSCSELRDAVNRAFGTWAANHKKISFTDATDECARHIAETGAAEIVHEIFLRAADTPPASPELLLSGLHRMAKPLGRAAAGFVCGLREHERSTQLPHPLVTPAIRASIPLPASDGPVGVAAEAEEELELDMEYLRAVPPAQPQTA